MQRVLDKLERGEHVTIVALGDSITQTNFHTQGRMNWVALLAEAIFARYGNGVCTLINAGKAGSTFVDANARLERDVLRFAPDLVIVALGMNDAGGGLAGLDQFKNLVRQTIERIRQRCSSELLIRTPNPIIATPGASGEPSGAVPGSAVQRRERPISAYAAALVEVARELDVPVVDHHQLWSQASFTVKHPAANPNGLWVRMSDAIHPNALGQLAFYRELAPRFDLPLYFPWEVMPEHNQP